MRSNQVRSHKGTFTFTAISLVFPDTSWRYYINEKGYPRFSTGPHRHKYIHRWVMEEMLGRPLTRKEVVHHVDHDRTNFKPANLMLLDAIIHNFLSSWHNRFLQANPQLLSDYIQAQHDSQMPDWVVDDCA